MGRRGPKRRRRYSVWNNKTDKLVACDKDYQECSVAMGIDPKNFYRQYMRSREGQLAKWTIIPTDVMEA